ncbi:uncharacterized protein LOC123260115 [Cotesia glomerata]|nr:uncharacterized protein LOC123260115 [Cotesia glomerata]
MDPSEKLSEDKILLNKIIWVIELLGSWPLNRTIKQTMLFIGAITYYVIHLSISCTALINVLGSLELMTANLMETTVQIIALIRLIYLKLSPSVKESIINIQQTLDTQSCDNTSEEKIYVYYLAIAKRYYSVLMTFSAITSLMFYLRPLPVCFSAWLNNQPVILKPPYEIIYVCFNLTSIEQVIIVYIYQAPMFFLPLGYIAIINLKLLIITNICSQLGVLSHRIRNLRTIGNDKIFGSIVRNHLKIWRLVKNIDNAWTLIFCFELILSTLLCSFVSYGALLAITVGKSVVAVSLITYVISSLLILFSNCLMGEMLKYESENFENAIYCLEWYDMSISNKRALLICMTRALFPLQLTAGKFYIYSFNVYTQEKFGEVKVLVDKIAWFINILGGWPIQPSLQHRLLFYLYLVYHHIYLSMSYNDLLMIFGSLDLMTANLTTTAIQTIVLIRMIYIKYSKNISKIIMTVNDKIVEKNDYDSAEKKIFLGYYSIARKYHLVTIVFAFVAGFSWCLLPLQTYLLALSLGKPAFLIYPYRVKIFFFNSTSFKSTVIIYLLESPLPLPPICYVAIINLQVVLVIYICAHMAILSNRICNLKFEKQSSYRLLGQLIDKHLEVIKLVKMIEKTWTPVYLFEILLLTPIVALVMYFGLLAFDAGEKVAFISLCTYVCASMSCLFANCLMGEMLKTECDRLLEAYYQCNWYVMPMKYREIVLICMIYTRNPFKITAGKVYEFSFNAFAGIVKNSLAYVSILRTLLV